MTDPKKIEELNELIWEDESLWDRAGEIYIPSLSKMILTREAAIQEELRAARQAYSDLLQNSFKELKSAQDLIDECEIYISSHEWMGVKEILSRIADFKQRQSSPNIAQIKSNPDGNVDGKID